MPLLDHFHPPLSKRRHWQNLHSAWANALRDLLNGGLLPPQFVAEVNVSLAGQLEVDLGAFEEPVSPTAVSQDVALWAPPNPSRTVVIEPGAQDVFELQVLSDKEGPRLVAAVELISPGNKDRPAHRQAFTVKCGSYLLQGVSLVTVDVVTSRRADLHADLLSLLSLPAEPAAPDTGSLSATAYHPLPGKEGTRLDYWREPVVLGQALPTLPLW